MHFNRYHSLILIGGIIFVSLFLWQCTDESSDLYVSPLGEIPQPDDNISSPEKVELGRKLFFDKRLSLDNSLSCSSCHIPKLAFTDGKNKSTGVEGRIAMRNAPSILNAAYLKTLMYDAHVPSLEMQATVPIQEHTEMDILVDSLIQRLREVPEYRLAAKKIYDREFDAWVLTRSLSAFERTLISDNSRFDQYYYQGNKSVLTNSELNGWKLFSEKLYCTKCHPAPFFTTYTAECNGLYTDYGEDKGRYRVTGDSSDRGKFKIPSLRNVALTGPYMHDGSINSLGQVIDFYSKGGKNHSNKNKIIHEFELSEQEKADLIAFLSALTDTSYLQR